MDECVRGVALLNGVEEEGRVSASPQLAFSSERDAMALSVLLIPDSLIGTLYVNDP
ncbi:hypothetical protein IRJ41_002411 [Triplophysa rosa]|uniref:Uncharacterized protein n=1 Tax=Triplophysa rosa TaxID=992332 RepID=A0A9W8CB98_TRIRA|nr:hypothetical protein IRJ41_002411 [Triplophysa rosa]